MAGKGAREIIRQKRKSRWGTNGFTSLERGWPFHWTNERQKEAPAITKGEGGLRFLQKKESSIQAGEKNASKDQRERGVKFYPLGKKMSPHTWEKRHSFHCRERPEDLLGSRKGGKK